MGSDIAIADEALLPARIRPWRIALPLAAVLLLYLGVGVFDHDVCSPTEPAVAGVVWSMAAEDAFIVPRINGYPYLEKPPLAYWLSSLACTIANSLHAGLIRLPSAVLGLLSPGLVYWIVRGRYGVGIGLITACSLRRPTTCTSCPIAQGWMSWPSRSPCRSTRRTSSRSSSCCRRSSSSCS